MSSGIRHAQDPIDGLEGRGTLAGTADNQELMFEDQIFSEYGLDTAAAEQLKEQSNAI